MHFQIKGFNQLSPFELYDIYSLRSRVFVVEQNCAYQDPDPKDLIALHVMLFDNETLAGYARIIPPGHSYPEPAIGRVVVDKAYRGSQSGRMLMKHCLIKTMELYKKQDIVISAQSYLEKFYASLGFLAEGHGYLEDDIPHIKMRYSPQ